MEEKHKLEIERLLAEKETALAEETQVGGARQNLSCTLCNILMNIPYISLSLSLSEMSGNPGRLGCHA